MPARSSPAPAMFVLVQVGVALAAFVTRRFTYPRSV
jgi:hypothetical protein